LQPSPWNPLRPVSLLRAAVIVHTEKNTNTVLNTLLRDEKWRLPVGRTTCVRPRIHFAEPFLRDSNYSGKLRSFVTDLLAILAILESLVRSRHFSRDACFDSSRTIIFAISRGIRGKIRSLDRLDHVSIDLLDSSLIPVESQRSRRERSNRSSSPRRNAAFKFDEYA